MKLVLARDELKRLENLVQAVRNTIQDYEEAESQKCLELFEGVSELKFALKMFAKVWDWKWKR